MRNPRYLNEKWMIGGFYYNRSGMSKKNEKLWKTWLRWRKRVPHDVRATRPGLMCPARLCIPFQHRRVHILRSFSRRPTDTKLLFSITASVIVHDLLHSSWILMNLFHEQIHQWGYTLHDAYVAWYRWWMNVSAAAEQPYRYARSTSMINSFYQ